MRIVTYLRDNLDEKSTLRRILKFIYDCPELLLGGAICKLPLPPVIRYKRHLLSTCFDSGKRTKIDKLLFPYVFGWLKLQYRKETNPDRREELKSLAMGGTSGEKWAKTYDSRPLDFSSKVGHMTFGEANPIFSK